MCWKAWWSTACDGLQSVVKIGAQPVLVGAWLAIGEVGLGWAKIFKCVLSVSACEECVGIV